MRRIIITAVVEFYVVTRIHNVCSPIIIEGLRARVVYIKYRQNNRRRVFSCQGAIIGCLWVKPLWFSAL